MPSPLQIHVESTEKCKAELLESATAAIEAHETKFFGHIHTFKLINHPAGKTKAFAWDVQPKIRGEEIRRVVMLAGNGINSPEAAYKKYVKDFLRDSL